MKPHVLVVDDSLTVRMDLRAALTTAGFMVTTCSTIETAQKWLDSHLCDLAILDILLPDGSGISLLTQIRETAKLQSIRVIMLSTMDEVSSRLRGLRLGADRYVGKPYERGHVVRAARELLKMPDATGSSPSHRPVSKKRKLLLVDDSPTFKNSLAVVLRQDGYEVVMAYSGEEAIELLTCESFDGVLIDLVLPGIDGLETCRRLRALDGVDQTVVVLMTASEHLISRADALAVGVDELTVKSADFHMFTVQLLCLLILRRQPSIRSSPPEPELPALDGASAQSSALLYQRVIAASGLSERLAKALINRAFERIGIDPTMIMPADLAHALGHIQDSLQNFLPAGETAERMADIADLAWAPATCTSGPRQRAGEGSMVGSLTGMQALGNSN